MGLTESINKNINSPYNKNPAIKNENLTTKSSYNGFRFSNSSKSNKIHPSSDHINKNESSTKLKIKNKSTKDIIENIYCHETENYNTENNQIIENLVFDSPSNEKIISKPILSIEKEELNNFLINAKLNEKIISKTTTNFFQNNRKPILNNLDTFDNKNKIENFFNKHKTNITNFNSALTKDVPWSAKNAYSPNNLVDLKTSPSKTPTNHYNVVNKRKKEL